MNETTILIIMILKRILKFKDVKVCIQEGAIKIVKLINKQADKGDISAIIGFNENIIREDFKEEIEYWMYQPRVIRI